MDRHLSPFIRKDTDKKIILLGGPRQVGKTVVSKSLFSSYESLNFDSAKDRKILSGSEWNRKVDLVVFDELHKKRAWKSWVKGIYDTEGVRPRILVTGSARLDVFKRGGDSLAGRHFYYRLHPFTVKEVASSIAPEDALGRILAVGGFPEPFLENSEVTSDRWRASHLDVILRQDLLDLERVREIRSIEILISLLADRVGSTTSYQSLAEDIGVSSHTIKHWLEILERLFVIFRVNPHSKNLANALRKEPKFYFYDTGAVQNGKAARLENAVACAFHAELHAIEDTQGKKTALHFLRDKQKHEVDFLVVVNKKAVCLAEVKLNDETFSPSLFYFRDRLRQPDLPTFQVVMGKPRKKEKNGVRLIPAHEFLLAPPLGVLG